MNYTIFYSVRIAATKNEFSCKIDINNIGKSIFLELLNTIYHELQSKY